MPDAMNWGIKYAIDIVLPATGGLIINMGNSDSQRMVMDRDFYLSKPHNYRNGQRFTLSLFMASPGPYDLIYTGSPANDKFWVFPSGFSLSPAVGCLNFITFLIDSTLDSGYGRAILQESSLGLFI